MKANKKSVVAEAPKDLLQEKEERLAMQISRSEFAVQTVQKSIDDLDKVNEDIKAEILAIDAYLMRFSDIRKGLAATRNKNERVMQNFSKLLCLDEEVAE